MTKKGKPILSDEFLDELVQEINQLYGGSLSQTPAESSDTPE